jgi:outer membrane protein TolC
MRMGLGILLKRLVAFAAITSVAFTAAAQPPGPSTPTRADIPAPGQPRAPGGAEEPPALPVSPPREALDVLTTPAPSVLPAEFQPIDLNTALRLAGVQNPELLIARQRVVEALALQQLAAAQFLPSINLGMNYDTHTGVLQQSNGNILSVQRAALYVGAGANAVAAGTVNIPGIVLTGNAAVAVYGYLASRQVVAQRQFATEALSNQTFLRVALAYSELLRAEGRRAVSIQARDDIKRVARQTVVWAEAGLGLPSDVDRAATELAQREADVQAAEGQILVASARLAYLLNIDPSIRLHPTDAWVVPSPIVPDPIPVRELIALALTRRPELGERRAAIREALLALDGARVLPFSPNVLLGFSAGGFGGGSNLVSPVFGGFGGRSDLDVYAYWSIQNLGVGNVALIKLARSRLGLTQYQEIAMLDRVRADVAEAYAKTHARYAQIGTSLSAVRTSVRGYHEDLTRILNRVIPALEVVDSMRLLVRSRMAYLDSIVDYNRAQFELYVALGQPPADSLAHPVPTSGVAPTPEPAVLPPRQPAGPREAPAAPPAAALSPLAPSARPAPATTADARVVGRAEGRATR